MPAVLGSSDGVAGRRRGVRGRQSARPRRLVQRRCDLRPRPHDPARRRRRRARRPDPVRRRGEPRQLGRTAAQPQRPGRRHRHRAREPHRTQNSFIGIGFAVPIATASGGAGGPPTMAPTTEERQHDRGTTRSARQAHGAGALRGQEGHRRAGPPARAADRRAARARPRARRGRARVSRRRWRSRRSPSAIGGEFQRIQFTPDLVPADLVGTRIYNQKTGEFHTSLGPVFTNLLLADEINRAPAKVQSALLEVMQERQVTIGRETHPVPEPVPRARDAEPDRVGGHVPAARGAGRPLHAQGARRLPDADRGVRDRRADDGRARAVRTTVIDRSSCSRCRRAADAVYVDPALMEYAVALVGATRDPRVGRAQRARCRTCCTARARVPRST